LSEHCAYIIPDRLLKTYASANAHTYRTVGKHSAVKSVASVDTADHEHALTLKL
jgi:hypothetical protein